MPPHSVPPHSVPPDIVPWTAPMDARLRRLRCEGANWHAVTADLRVSLHAVRARARRLDLPEWTAADLPGAPPPSDPHRPPLPAGHELAWRVLTDGTLLQGTSSASTPMPAI